MDGWKDMVLKSRIDIFEEKGIYFSALLHMLIYPYTAAKIQQSRCTEVD